MIDVDAIVDACDRVAAAYVENEIATGRRRARKFHGPLAGDDWRRIVAIPSHEWQREDIQRVTVALSERLRRDGSRAALFPTQAIALIELVAARGLVGALCVGAGKTLVTLLAPVVVGAARPVLFVPGKLVAKTVEERKDYARDWAMAPLLPIMSYEKLARSGQADWLDTYRPDMIIADESHKLANWRDTSAARRIGRYLAGAGDTIFVAVSGTLTNRSLRDFAHLLRWALGDQAPVPFGWAALESWADALDAGADGPLGCLSQWGATRDAVRVAFRERLTATVGFVATNDRPDVDLTIRPWAWQPPVSVAAALREMQSVWETPDGQPIADGLRMAQHCYTVALGYWLRWRYPAPQDWLHARREWCAYVRDRVRYSRKPYYDTEEQVALAVDRGDLADPEGALDRWRAIEPSFIPETEVIWFDRSPLLAALSWASEPGIVWYDHVPIADALAEEGLPVYRQRGETIDGEHVRHETGERAIAASIRSTGEGQNLQQFARNLVLEPPSTGKTWEQMLGRTHRSGQLRAVDCEVYLTSERHESLMRRAVASARYQQQITGQDQKLIYGHNTTIQR